MTADPSAPEEFGPYLVYERLGVGGMATVHRAKKVGLAGFERGVALKRLLPHLAEDPEFIHSFVREAKLASLLVHPNIAQIYEFGRVGSTYYIAMEHVDGIDVRKVLRYARRSGEAVPLPVVLSVLVELCEALEYAHTFVDETGEPQGIIHRDVSPSNLLIANSGHLKVIDFGIAKASSPQHHTESGRVKGKLGYMSPEAALGKIYGPASDVFSAGVVAYELITTQPLFSSKTDYETLLKIHHSEVSPPSQLNPACPSALDEVVLAALTRAPEDRLQSAAEFRGALEEVATATGMRLSSRDVFDWLAGVSTDAWGGASRSMARPSSTQLPSMSAHLPLPLPPPAEPSGFTLGRTTSIARAAALAETGQALGPGGALTELPRSSRDDDLLADLAWGGDLSSALYPPIAESSSVMPHPMGTSPVPVHLQAEAPAAGPAPGRARSRWGALAAIVLALGGAALAGVTWLGPRDAATLAPAPAVLNFAVQPDDAIIEIGGHEVSRVSPFQATLDPGMYSIAIRRAGHKAWSGEVTLRGGEAQSIQVVLEKRSQTARVSLASRRAGMIIEIDGHPLAQVTPAQLEISPGPHSITVTDPKDPTSQWTHEFDAVADVDYAFEPLPQRDPAATEPAERAEPAAASEGSAEVPHASRRASRRPLRRAETAAAPALAQAPVQAVTSALVPRDFGLAAKVPPPPTRVRVVAAASLTKISGAMPTLRVRSDHRSFDDALAKLCIDDRGRVSSATLLRAAPEIADTLQRALLSWRYQPYVAQGVPSPVCFSLKLRVVVAPPR